MKLKNTLLFVLIAALAGAGGWFAAKDFTNTKPVASAEAGRKIKLYQSPMHPWITSPTAGRCTVCGMELVPVYEGDHGFDAAAGLVTLSSNSVNVLHVQNAEVKRRALSRTLRVAGMIEDDDTKHRRLSAYVEGRVDRLFVNFLGAEVVAGQPLASVYSPMLLAAEREYVSLLNASRAGSDASMETDRLLAAAAQRLVRMGLMPKQMAALPAKSATNLATEILSPMTGTVVARDVYAGQYVKEGDKLFELADFSTMWLKADVYERDLPWLKLGDAVSVTTPALPGRIYHGKISFIDPNLVEMTRSAKVRVELPNPLIETNGVRKRELLHRLYAEASVKADLGQVLSVPRSAVLSPGAEPLVYVDKGGGAYEQRRVQLGRAADEYWEVLGGLVEGDLVVTQGNLLIDGQAQLSQSANVVAQHDHGAPPVTQNLTPEQIKAMNAFLVYVDSLGAALAADDLTGFNTKALHAAHAVTPLNDSFKASENFRAMLDQLIASAKLPETSELRVARKAFLPFSMAVVELTRAVRHQPGVTDLVRVYQCPMTKDVFDGAPSTAMWMQLKAPKQNPYMGQRMLDCGTEVK